MSAKNVLLSDDGEVGERRDLSSQQYGEEGGLPAESDPGAHVLTSLNVRTSRKSSFGISNLGSRHGISSAGSSSQVLHVSAWLSASRFSPAASATSLINDFDWACLGSFPKGTPRLAGIDINR
jgi:hypothetical protein